MSADNQHILMLALLLFGLLAGLSTGFPVAFVLGGVALLVAGLGVLLGNFDPSFLEAFPSRVFGTMSNETLVAVPLFVFMGMTGFERLDMCVSRSVRIDRVLPVMRSCRHPTVSRTPPNGQNQPRGAPSCCYAS